MTRRPKPALGRVRLAMVLYILAVSGCTDGGVPGFGGVDKRSFKGHYIAARSALEGGDYDKAINRYRDLVGQAGPVTARIRVEYAHALLRANQFKAAANEAHMAAIDLTGLARASALSVQATAKHEEALALMSQGTYDKGVHDALAASLKIFEQIAPDLPTLDPKGGLQRRHSSARRAEAELKATLGL